MEELCLVLIAFFKGFRYRLRQSGQGREAEAYLGGWLGS